MPHWSPSPTYLGVVGQYFTSYPVMTGITIALFALAVTFFIFAISKNHEKKSSSLLWSIMISTAMWVFVVSSLVLCAVFMSDYVLSASTAIIDVAKFALIPAISVGPVLTYYLRNRAMKRLYPYLSSSKVEDLGSTEGLTARVGALFSNLLYSAKLSNVSLNVLPGSGELPASAALDWKGERVVSISSMIAAALDDEEIKAVLAHELGHIVHKDSMRKTLATSYRSAFIFDPVAHFVEAAIYRDGELCADEYSAELTGKPAALASALIKIHESMQSATMPSLQVASLLLNRRDTGILSKEPSLTQRIKRLLEMQEESAPEKEETPVVTEDPAAA
jgi:Zn-dependent protease with chaperone function